LQEQTRLKRSYREVLCGFRPWGSVLAILFLLSVCVPLTIVAQDTAEDEIAAQRKKAKELLDTASAQLDRQQYKACQATLERCSSYENRLSSSQKMRYDKYSQQAQAGVSAQSNADAAIQAGMQHLNANRLGQAEEQFKAAQKLKKYLPAPQRKKIEDQLKVIKAKKKQLKKEYITLFKNSKSNYKADRLDEAEKGFTKIQQSGIKLGFFDTGDLTSTSGYLKKITSKRAKETEAQRKRQQELLKQQAEAKAKEAEKKQEKSEPTPTAVAPAPTKVDPTPTVVEPTPTKVEPTPTIIDPTPTKVEPTPTKVEPAETEVKPVSEKVTAEDELAQAAAPTPSVTTPSKTEPKDVVESKPVIEEKKEKKKFDILGVFKKKKPEISPETIKLVNQKIALADQAMLRRNYAQAKQLFMEALALDPKSQAAQKGLNAAEYELAHPQTAPPKAESSILMRLIEREERQKQFIEASYTEARQNVFLLMDQKLFDDARAQVTSVLAKIEGHKQLLGPASYQRMRSEAQGWLDIIEKKQREFEDQALIDKRDKARLDQIEQQKRIETARIKKITELWNRALTLKAEREYQQAIGTLETLLELDPKNNQAKMVLTDLEELQLILRQRDTRHQIEVEIQKNLTDADASSIPFRDKIVYPGQDPKFEDQPNWLDITERRKQTLEGLTPVDVAVYEKMSDTKVALDYQETEFSQVLADMQNNHGLNINPLWGSLETTAGINKDDTVTLQLNNVPLEKALESILEYVSSGKYAKAAYTVDLGVITIAAEDDLPERYYVQDYYIADLVGQQAMGGGMGGMGGGMMGGMGGMGGMMGGMGGMGGMMGGRGGMMGGMGGRGRGGMGGRSGGYGGGSRGGRGGRGGYGSGYGSDQGSYEGMYPTNPSELALTMYGGGRSGGYGGSRGGGSRGGMGGSRGGMMGGMGGRGGMMGGMGGMGGMMGGMGGMGGMMGGMGGGMGGSYMTYMNIDNLIYLLQQAVGLDQWEGEDELQQAEGTIEVYGFTTLIVKQTWKNHRVIEQLLTRLRKTLGEQVALEIRMLEINSNFLEDIGLDIDFFLNLGNAGYDDSGEINNAYGNKLLIPRTNPGPWNRTTPVPIIQRSYDLSMPATTSIPGSLGGGANQAFLLSGSFLDNVQVDFLMRATQAHQRSRFLDAPHVTVFNGESASVTFDVEQPYVSELTAVVDNRIGLFEPTIDTANTGVNFMITPTISADKRYVILNVFFTLENVLRFETFTFNVGGTATADTTDEEDPVDGGGDGLIISGGAASTGTLQQPVTEINSIQTRVMVPDGGTLMLGGRKRTTEVEKEVGVPALSKLPLISRLFTNRSLVNDSAVLLILVKPKIILPKEEEELRFGSFETDAATR
jgi:type II/III secretion system protein